MEPLYTRTVVAITYVALLAPPPPMMLASTPITSDNAGTSVTIGGVVIDDFAPDGLLADEFVELRNTSTKPVDVSGWALLVCVTPTTTDLAITFPDNTVIAAGEQVLLTHPDWANPGAAPDYHYDVDVPEDGGWLLRDPFSGYTDGVGLRGGLACAEGNPAPRCDWDAGEAVTRDPLGRDTDDNFADFTCMPRTPGF